MYTFIVILILIASALLILTVLAQNPKGGMAANFGASNQVMGVRQTADILEKFTWGLAIAIVVLSLTATLSIPKKDIDASRSGLERTIQEQQMLDASQSFELPIQAEQPAQTPAEDEE